MQHEDGGGPCTIGVGVDTARRCSFREEDCEAVFKVPDDTVARCGRGRLPANLAAVESRGGSDAVNSVVVALRPRCRDRSVRSYLCAAQRGATDDERAADDDEVPDDVLTSEGQTERRDGAAHLEQHDQRQEGARRLWQEQQEREPSARGDEERDLDGDLPQAEQGDDDLEGRPLDRRSHQVVGGGHLSERLEDTEPDQHEP